MKKLLILGLGICAAVVCHGQTTNIIALWNFDALTAPAAPGAGNWVTNIAADSGSGVAAGWHFAAATYSTPSGNGSAKSLSSTAWTNNPGDLWQFAVSTVGFANIGISFDQTSSQTGPGRFNLAYSTDGSSFTTFLANYSVLQNGLAPNAAWGATYVPAAYSYTNDLSAITALNNAATVYFRLVDSSTIRPDGGTVNPSSGADRIDNVIIYSVTPVPEPSSLVLALGGLLGYCWITRRSRR